MEYSHFSVLMHDHALQFQSEFIGKNLPEPRPSINTIREAAGGYPTRR